jgi:hypothetical protein
LREERLVLLLVVGVVIEKYVQIADEDDDENENLGDWPMFPLLSPCCLG